MPIAVVSARECPVLGDVNFSVRRYALRALLASCIAAAAFALQAPMWMTAASLGLSGCYFASALIVVLNRNVVRGICVPFIRVLHGIVTEADSIMQSVYLFPYTLFQRYHNAPKKEGRPILLVNGYFSFGSSWDVFRKRLSQQAGIGPIYTMNVGSFRSIQTYAHQVRQRLSTIEALTNRTDIILIGHSKGGLVCTDYVTSYRERYIPALITIGSPLQGTFLARIAPGLDAAEMRSGSKFISNLFRRSLPIGTKRLHVGSKADLIVPLDSALVSSDLPNVEHCQIDDLGHLALIFSAQVANRVGRFIMAIP